MDRMDAIRSLENAVVLDAQSCSVDGVKVRTEDKDILLAQLLRGDVHLRVPLPLYLSSLEWRELKAASNLQVMEDPRA